MEELIKAYLQHIGHYLAGNDVLSYSGVIGNSDIYYEVTVVNPCLNRATDVVEVDNSELLTFLYERTL